MSSSRQWNRENQPIDSLFRKLICVLDCDDTVRFLSDVRGGLLLPSTSVAMDGIELLRKSGYPDEWSSSSSLG